ncbi:MAG: ParB/RepB/Spo0J family partition protein [Thermodesulfobacteriota bacterium]
MKPLKGEVVSIAIDRIDLRFLPLRTPTALSVKRMASSLKARGQITPIVITCDPPSLVDGFKRMQAAQSLGMSELKAVPIKVEPTQAKAGMYLMNRSESFSLIQEAMLVRELIDGDGLGQKDAAAILERHKSWVNRRLYMIRRLAPEIIQDLKLQLLPPGSAPALARLQQRNQPEFSIAIQNHRLSTKQINRLIDLWCKATDPAVKRFLLQSPTESLKAIQEENPSPYQDLIGKMWRILEQLDRQCQGENNVHQALKQVQTGLMAIHQALSQRNP